MPAQIATAAQDHDQLPAVARAAFAGALTTDGGHWTETVLQFAANEEIYAEGDDTNTCYEVVSGVVRTCKYLSDGRRQIDSFQVAGEVFGLELGEERGFAAEAVSGCTVICYRRSKTRKLTTDDSQLPVELFSFAMRSAARAQAHALMLGRLSAIEKLVAFLVEWADHSADGDMISLAMNRSDIADYLGLTFETVSRTLSQLERDGLIKLPSARQIQLMDIETLREFNS